MITILNMLIAIMSDTYDKVIEQKPTFALKNKLRVVAAMESSIRSKEHSFDEKMYLYVIQPVHSGEDEYIDSQSDSWRGKIYYTHDMIKTRFNAVTDNVKAIEKTLQGLSNRMDTQ